MLSLAFTTSKEDTSWVNTSEGSDKATLQPFGANLPLWQKPVQKTSL